MILLLLLLPLLAFAESESGGAGSGRNNTKPINRNALDAARDAADANRECAEYRSEISYSCRDSTDNSTSCEDAKRRYANLQCDDLPPASPPPPSSCSSPLDPDCGNPPPVVTPPPTDTTLADKFGKNWAATKQNEDLFKDKALMDEASKDANLSQDNSYVMASNTLYGCVETSASGRKDEQCENDPGHPECVGIAGALKNATNCLEYFTPATLGCKVYGTSEYGLDEWIAIGEQFQTTMVGCAEKKQKLDDEKTGPKLKSLTDFVGGFDPKKSIPGTPDLRGVILAPSSTISGSIKPDTNVSTLDWEELSGRIKDGASYLGYQDGDILRASIKGESFSSIVTASPFAEKLNFVNRAKLDEGLADSAMVAKRVIQTYNEKNGGTVENQMGDSGTELSSSGVSAGGGETGTGIEVVQSSVLDYAKNSAPKNSGAAIAAAPDAGAGSDSDSDKSRRLLEAERIEAVARAAAQSRIEQKPYRAPSSVPQSNVGDLLDTTLFARISNTYRKRSGMMNPLDSRNGDLIRSIERPEIFRNL